MRQMLRISVTCFIVAIACVAILALDADAQTYMTSRPGGRAGTWDFFLPLTYNPAFGWNGSQGGSKVDLDATWGFGFGFGYNLSDHFQLNGLFSWAARNYRATVVPATPPGAPKQYSGTEYSSTFSLNGIFYILPGDISPFVAAGVGWTYIDTGIPNGNYGSTCWWDPWYGYICNGGYPTKTESDWSYTIGVGVRFDLSRQFSLQPSYNKAWINLQNAGGGSPYFDIWRLDFIFRM